MPDQTISLRFKVEGDNVILDKFSGSLAKVGDQANKAGSALSVIKWDAIVNLGSRALEMGKQFYESGKQIANTAEGLTRMAEISGMGIKQFTEMSYVARLADVDLDSFGKSIKFLSDKITESKDPTSAAAKLFKQMGVDTAQPLANIMGQVSDKFKTYAKDADRITLSTYLFGKAGYQALPYWALGTEGAEKLRKKLLEYGVVVDEKLLKQGADVAEHFKLQGIAMENLKMKMVPFIADLTKIVDLYIKLKGAITEGMGLFGDYARTGMKFIPGLSPLSMLWEATSKGSPIGRMMSELDAEAERKRGWAGSGPSLVGAPHPPGAGGKEHEIKDVHEYQKAFEAEAKMYDEVMKGYTTRYSTGRRYEGLEEHPGGIISFDAIVEGEQKLIVPTKELEDELKKLDAIFLETFSGTTPTMTDSIMKMAEGYTAMEENMNKAMVTGEHVNEGLQERYEWEKKLLELTTEENLKWAEASDRAMQETLTKGGPRTTEYFGEKYKRQFQMVDGYWTSTVESMAHTWMSGFSSLITKSLQGDVKGGFMDFCNSILESFTKTLQEMAAQYMIWGSIFGKEGFSGGGLIGLLGLGKSIPQGGGGGGGPGFFSTIPIGEGLSGGSSRGGGRQGMTMNIGTYVANVNATDAQSFDRQMKRSIHGNNLYATSRVNVL
jgi:hypothetical protein